MEKAAQWVWQLEVQSQTLKQMENTRVWKSISEIPQSGRKEAFMSIIGQIDVEEYKWGDGGTYIIMGWAVSEKKERVEVRLLGDGKVSLPCDSVACARPDVKETRKDLNISDDRIGFQVRLCPLEQMFKNFQSLQLIVVQGEEQKVLLKRTIEEMKDGYRNAALKYFIDQECVRNKEIVVDGWIIDARRQEKVSLRDENGHASLYH